MGRWRTGWKCVHCDGSISYGTKMSSHGRCPLCGYRAIGACTIVETTEYAYRLLPRTKWWRFWEPRTREVRHG